MKKGLEIFLKVLLSIIAFPFCIAGAILMTPFVLIGLLISIPASAFESIWVDEFNGEE
jgi:hypothetical protein